MLFLCVFFTIFVTSEGSCSSSYRCFGHGSYAYGSCSCYSGYIGQCCNDGRDYCQSQPCLNGGTCINDVSYKRYTCTCLAGDFGRRCEQRSNITDSPRITLINVKVIAEGTSLVKIPCIAEGIPTPVVTWEAVDGSYPTNVKQIAHYLIIQNVTIGDTGYYTCSAKNRAGLDIKTVHVLVNATNLTLVAPVIIASPDVIVNLDTEAVIVCNVTGYPTPDIKWVYDHDNNSSTVLISGGSLRIPNATSEASGLYTCIASNDAGSAKAFVFLDVVHGSIPPRVAPVITTSPHVIVNYYTEAEIVCNVTGFPTPHITWEYDQGSTVLISGGTLRIPNATNEASGLYTCIASNDAGSAKAFVRLEVVHDPSNIFSPPDPFSGSAGVSQNFSCKASGHPQPTITWKFTSFTRQTSVLPAHTLFENGEVLEISNLQESGIISCKAINEFGKDEASAHVIVHHDSAVFG